jgi:hypothetical protein
MMKNRYLIVLLLLISGCLADGNEGTPEDFKIVNQGQIVLDLSDIDYYDFSTHNHLNLPTLLRMFQQAET